jgi:3-dehydrosphinganine reductase
MVSVAGPVDVLINNAGISKSAEMSDMPAEDFEEMIRVNYLGSVYCTKAVVDSMKDRRSGRIGFVCSQSGQIGVYGYTAYSASKFAIRGFAETLQMELRPYGVFTTISFPPDTDTPGFKQENLYKVLFNRFVDNFD